MGNGLGFQALAGRAVLEPGVQDGKQFAHAGGRRQLFRPAEDK